MRPHNIQKSNGPLGEGLRYLKKKYLPEAFIKLLNVNKWKYYKKNLI
jgi:hypothetical protein